MNKLQRRVVEASLCIGCGTCESICPSDAISLVLNKKKGMYFPLVAPEKCNNCNVCFEICPGHEVKYNDLNIKYFGHLPKEPRVGNYVHSYSCYSNDDQLRFDSASGGMVSTLLLYALEKKIIDGALVTGMKTDVPWEPKPFIARTKAEILEAAGSKYCPVPVNSALKEIMKIKGRYAVVGLPCHIHAIRKAQKYNKLLRERIIYCFGLFCSSGRTFIGLQALMSKLKVDLSQITSLRYRGAGWPGEMNVKINDGRVLSIGLETYFPLISCSNNPYRCSLCPDKTAELADLSFGDLWLPEARKNIGHGKSICIVRNQQSEVLVKSAEKDGYISRKQLNSRDVLRAIGYENKKKKISARLFICKLFRKPVPEIDLFLCQYNVHDIADALKYYLVEILCGNSLLKRLYFLSRSKYRAVRREVKTKPPRRESLA